MSNPNDKSPTTAAAGSSETSSPVVPPAHEDGDVQTPTGGGSFEFADLTEPQWQDAHNDPYTITASQAARILGISKFGGSAFTLYQEKIGAIPRFEGNISTEVGHELEPYLAKKYVEITKRKVQDPGDYRIYHCPDNNWLICTPDRFDEDDRVVELKNLGAYARKDWANGMGPLEYQVQNQIQLYCTGLEQGSLIGLIANREIFIHDFDLHDRVLKSIIPKLAEFRERCINRDPPPVDGSVSTEATLKALHPKDTGEVLYDDLVAPYLKERRKLKGDLGAINRNLILVENRIKDSMGDASELWADGMKVTWKHHHVKGSYRKAYDARVLRGPT